MPSPQGMNVTGAPCVVGPLWQRSTEHRQTKNMASQIKQNDWKKHQSVAAICKCDGRQCQHQFCPGKLQKWSNGGKKAHQTEYRCVQCTVEQGQPVFLCNNTKVIDGEQMVVLCHMKCHAQKSKETSTNDDA